MDGEGDAGEVARRLKRGGPTLGSNSYKVCLFLKALSMRPFSLHIYQVAKTLEEGKANASRRKKRGESFLRHLEQNRVSILDR
jgi:hypothetical protein